MHSIWKCCVKTISLMMLISNSISWTDSIKYLGIQINGGNKLLFDTKPVKRSLYVAFNSIASECKSSSGLVQLHLFECYCLPLLLYALPAISDSHKQLNELCVCWNTVFGIVFGFNKFESMKCFIWGPGRLNFERTDLQRKVVPSSFNTFSNGALFSLVWVHCVIVITLMLVSSTFY
jgi:hypothetical protein